jgi:hypothetical protein
MVWFVMKQVVRIAIYFARQSVNGVVQNFRLPKDGRNFAMTIVTKRITDYNL